MKNKSKLNKIKNGNKKVTMPGNWFLMLRTGTDVEAIKAVLPEDADIEIWKEAGVITIMLDDEHSMDIEMLEPDLGDEYSNHYMKTNGIVCLYAISFKSEAYDLAKPYMSKINASFDGFICADTEDFKPIFK